MELKGCSRMHFVQAIEGGLVETIDSVDSHGRRALRFKKIKAIHESEDARNLEFCSTHQQQNQGFRRSPLVCDKVKIERQLLPMGGTTLNSNPEICELNEDAGDNTGNCGKDDLSFSEMTLKQLMERSKTKRRKLLKCVDLSKQEPFFHLNRDFVHVRREADESDLQETLGSWKLKLSKKSKAKLKCISKEVSPFSKSAVSVGVTEQILSSHQDSLQNIGDLNGPNNIKMEISEPDSSYCHNAACFADGSTFDCHARMDFNGYLSQELPERVKGRELEVGELNSLTKESLGCVVNEVSIEYQGHREPIFSLPGSATVREATTSNFSEMTCQEYVSSVSEIDNNITHLLPSVNPLEAIYVSKEPGSGTYGSCASYSFLQKELLCEMSNNSVIQMPDMDHDDCLRGMEPNYEGDQYFFDREVENDRKVTPDDEIKAISNPSYPCLNPPTVFSSTDYKSHTTENYPSLTTEGPLSSSADRARDCSVETHPSDVTDGLTAMEVLENHCALKLGCPPKRLFTTRKAISPISQEKLRQAAGADDLLDDIELSKCKERLCFGKQAKNNALSAESGLEGAAVTRSPKRIIIKPKNDKKGPKLSVPKGILKDPRVSCAMPHGDAECTTIHTCTQNAIAFSQRQMHDIECLAMKLLKELNYLKDVVEETLHSEVYPSTSSNFAVDEVRKTVDNAAELEETTRRGLSMMTRDCSRFCKIMRTTEKKTSAVAASGYGHPKDKKKITFADEAGGMLCHVKVFEDEPASLLSSEHEDEKPEANKN